MKKKTYKALIGIALCVSMLGTTAFADFDGVMTAPPASGQTIEGNATVKDPIYNVVVPTSLNFAIDAFEQGGQTGSQIASANFPIYNKSNVAVRVEAAVKLTPATGVTLKSTADDVSEADTTKNLYMALEVAKGVALNFAEEAAPDSPAEIGNYRVNKDDATKIVLATGLSDEEKLDTGDYGTVATAANVKMEDVTGSTVTYAGASDTPYTIALSSTPITVAFKLAKANYYQVYENSANADAGKGADKYYKKADEDEGGAAFRFTGIVNSKSAWVASDVSAEVVYNFLGMKASYYDSAQTETDTQGLLKEKKNVVESDGTNDIEIYYTGDKPSSVVVTPVSCTGPATSAMTLNNTHMSIDETQKKITIKKDYISSIIANNQRGKGTYKVTFNSTDVTVKFK